MTNLFLIIVLVGASAFLGAGALFYVYQKRQRETGVVTKRDDLASMMILLQTMRDLLEQQKGFARELNKALDARVEFIKQTVESARSEMTAMRESVKQINDDVERIKQESVKLAEMQQAQAQAQPAAAEQPVRKAPANVRQLSAYTPPPIEPPAPPKEQERPTLRVLAMPREPEIATDALDAWTGLDFAGDEPEPLGFDVPETEPEMPHDADAARSAFRALLNLAPEEQIERNSIVPMPRSKPPATTGNGRPVPPLHARVYEYNDAGMNVAQIAQELGIGKGEVRLILSLRKTKGD
ncbi:MAG: hypothetical protein IT366_19690 [Candidatus Hydrogenedentes bacterium]|nr:hypothetical protein [Candidatus Hydrogenedentota bacterium]